MRGPLVLTLSMLVVVACTASYPPCYRGEHQGCVCANGAPGYQACNLTEDGFGACTCDGTTPGLDGGRDASIADAPVAASSEAGAPGAYLQSCAPGDTCTGPGAVCFSFPSKGGVCTTRCTISAECPPPSPGCTPKQGVCRPP